MARSKGPGALARRGPAPQVEAPVPALRLRLAAAVAGGFGHIWMWLQRSGIGRLVGYFFPPRCVRLHPAVADQAGPAVKIRANWFEKKPKSKPKPQPSPDSPPAAPAPRPPCRLHVVDEIEVPLEQEILYEEYCRRGMNCQAKSFLCHMCIFDGVQYVTNGIVKGSGIVNHCYTFHDGKGIECEVRFGESSLRERRLHMYFFHQLPKGWWLKHQ